MTKMCGNTAQTDTRFTGLQACVAPDSDHLVLPAGKTTLNDVVSASAVFTLTLIDVAVEKAKSLAVPIRPIMINGEEKYVLFMHHTQVTDMRTNTNTGQWYDIQKAALQGGNITQNPIYTGAVGEYNGTIIHASNRIPLAQTANSAVASTRVAVFAGAQAVAMAFGRDNGPERFNWVEDYFDYENQFGVAAGCIAGMIKNNFNGSDFAPIALPPYSIAPTTSIGDLNWQLLRQALRKRKILSSSTHRSIWKKASLLVLRSTHLQRPNRLVTLFKCCRSRRGLPWWAYSRFGVWAVRPLPQILATRHHRVAITRPCHRTRRLFSTQTPDLVTATPLIPCLQSPLEPQPLRQQPARVR